MGPLAGLRVIELAHIMAGPVCGRMLADMGADVIKVERAPGGDPARSFVPPDVNGEAAAFMMLNRNKRGIAIDVKAKHGVSIVRRLIARSDIVIENFRTGTMDRLGLAYDSFAEANPGLIFCEISGFGRTGPMADIGGFDLIAQGYCALMSITGEEAGHAPVKCGPPLTDITAGILGAMGILAALHQRHKTGKGQRVDTSLFEAGITQTYWHSAVSLATNRSPAPMGSAHSLTAPYEAFETADGWITIGASSQITWERLARAMNMSQLLEDERFHDNAGRMAHRKGLVSILAERFAEKSTVEWIELLQESGVPVGPVLNISEMLCHPQTIARNMVVDVEHTTLGPVATLGFPVKFDGTATPIDRGAPLLGEHTREVLAEHGYSMREIDDFVSSGTVVEQSNIDY